MRPKWFDRTFTFDLPIWMAPNVLTRLRGTPARLEELVRPITRERLVRRDGSAWSIQENVGHLWDLEPLWLGRVDDFDAAAETLRAADLANQKTAGANHNEASIAKLLAAFRTERAVLVTRLEALSEAGWGRSALHPRLRTPMRLIDHAFFVAEHDDHHLVTIRELV